MSTTDDVSYENMKAIIMRVFGSEIKCRASSEISSVDIKVEPTYANVCSDDAAGDSSFYARSNTRGRYNFWPRGNRRVGRRPRGNHSARKSNPVGNDGNISRCIICDSRMHWARDCPHSYEKLKFTSSYDSGRKAAAKEDDDDECIQFSLFMENISNSPKKSVKLEKILLETKHCALMDTACPATVCGKEWLNNYVASLTSIL